MRFGAHISIADHLHMAVDRAAAIGCDTIQIFPGNPRGWKTRPFPQEEVDMFVDKRRKAAIYPVAIHIPYLVNLCSPSQRVREASLASVRDSLQKAKQIGAQYLVMHPGSHGGDGVDTGVARLVQGLKEIGKKDFGPVKILLENTAGAGKTIGSTLEEIATVIIGTAHYEHIGLCFDTCHAYAAGYDIASTDGLDSFFQKLDKSIGLDRLFLIHANDCKGSLGSRLDRHQAIGRGHIGLDGFRRLINRQELKDKAVIIETPKKPIQDDIENLALLRKLREGCD